MNNTHEVHPFHIHQVHFLVYNENGQRLDHPEWLDTVNVSVEGSVDLMMDFTNPIIRGVSLFHCHLLSHEDKGMMAKYFLSELSHTQLIASDPKCRPIDKPYH